MGYANTFYTGTFKPEEMLHYGRAPWRVVSPGYAIKMFPSQFGTHFAITAGLTLHKQITDPAEIRAVTLTAPMMPYVDRPSPETGLSGKFSLQYTMASGLLDGKVGIHTFTEQRLRAPDMQALLPKITLVLDKTIPARFETMHVLLRAELRDGRVLETRCDGPAGMWGQPPITDEAHGVKLRDCLTTRLSPEAAERCISLAGSIDTLETINDLMALAA